MENPYIKQFPDLMPGKKVMYVHGFLSSAQSGTVRMLRELMPGATVVAEDIPLHPAEAMEMLQQMADREQPDLIIGTSMGGMYAEMLRGRDRILVNPAFLMGETIPKNGMTGRQEYQNPRRDGVQEVIVTKSLVREYAEITTHCFNGINDEERRRVYALFGDADPVVHTFDLFHRHYPNAIHFHGGHRLIDKVALHDLIPVIRWIDDRQNGRERSVVHIAFSTLHDSYMKPASSMHKAYEALLERYNVYIVVPALTNDHAAIAESQSWVEQYLSTPAWNHVICCNQKALLYGDYFIDDAPDDAFMGTTIAYGSDEFKTWEDIVTYFKRLGGEG